MGHHPQECELSVVYHMHLKPGVPVSLGHDLQIKLFHGAAGWSVTDRNSANIDFLGGAGGGEWLPRYPSGVLFFSFLFKGSVVKI